jgi:hypothetical protein
MNKPRLYDLENTFGFLAILNLRTAVQREGFAQDFEADAGCAFPTRTLRCVERKAQAADGQKIVQNRPH